MVRAGPKRVWRAGCGSEANFGMWTPGGCWRGEDGDRTVGTVWGKGVERGEGGSASPLQWRRPPARGDLVVSPPTVSMPFSRLNAGPIPPVAPMPLVTLLFPGQIYPPASRPCFLCPRCSSASCRALLRSTVHFIHPTPFPKALPPRALLPTPHTLFQPRM